MSDDGIVRFVIVGCQRSGTTVTREAVLQHPQVSMLREELSVSPLFTDGMRAFTHGREPYAERRRANLALFDAFAKLYTTPRTRAVGVKVALSSPEAAADLRNFLYEFVPDVRVIHVVRGDLVAQFSSLQRALKTGEWDLRGGSRMRGADPSMKLPERAFGEYVAKALAITGQLRQIAKDSPVLELLYERDINCAEPGWARVFEFLGLEIVDPTWMLMKKVAPPVDSYVKNAKRLREVCAKILSPGEVETEALATRRMVEGATSDSPEVLARRYAWMRGSRRGGAATAIAQALVEAAPRPTSSHREVDLLLQALVGSREFNRVTLRSGSEPAWWASFFAGESGSRRAALQAATAGLRAEPAGRLLELARLVSSLEEWAAADVLCEVALAQMPTQRPLRRALFELLASVLERAQDGERARELVTRFEADFADDAAFAVFEAQATLPVDPTRARVALERAVSLDSQYADLLRFLPEA